MSCRLLRGIRFFSDRTGRTAPRWDTENRNGPPCAYPPRRGLLRFVPTSAHYNRCTRGPDIPPRGLQKTLSRYQTKNYCRTVNAKRFALFPCGMAALTQIKAPKAVTRQSQTRHYTVDVRIAVWPAHRWVSYCGQPTWLYISSAYEARVTN